MTTSTVHSASVIRSDLFREIETANTLWSSPSAQIFPFKKDLDWPSSIAGQEMDTYHRWMETVIVPSLIGAPAICIPAGFHNGLPIGLQIYGPRGTDHALIELAEAYHETTDWPAQMPSPI